MHVTDATGYVFIFTNFASRIDAQPLMNLRHLYVAQVQTTAPEWYLDSARINMH